MRPGIIGRENQRYDIIEAGHELRQIGAAENEVGRRITQTAGAGVDTAQSGTPGNILRGAGLKLHKTYGAGGAADMGVETAFLTRHPQRKTIGKGIPFGLSCVEHRPAFGIERRAQPARAASRENGGFK